MSDVPLSARILSQGASGEIDEEDLIQSPDDFSDVPYAEPAWVRGRYSPYYNEGHREYRLAIRKFIHGAAVSLL